MAKIFDSYGRAKAATAFIESEGQKIGAELNRRQAEGRNLAAQLETLAAKYNNTALSQTAREDAKKQARSIEDKIDAKREEFEHYQAQARQTLAQKEQTQRETVYNEIQRAVTAVAHRQGATLVLNVSEKTVVGLPAVVYSDPKWDITSSVIATLNAGAQ
jgi:Skp family chaperone for outer membrane proteins